MNLFYSYYLRNLLNYWVKSPWIYFIDYILFLFLRYFITYLLKSTDSADAQTKLELLEELESLRVTLLTEQESEKYNELYLKYKPTISENDVYELISCDISFFRKISAIINCRVNGEHKQIRF